jgi:tetratricopeptide (TPR) repeat protein
MSEVIENAAALYKAGRLREAEQLCHDALSQDPMSATGHFVLGLCYLASSRFEPAAQRFRQSISLKPHTANYHYHLGLALDRMNRLKEATEAYARSIELNSDEPNYHASLGELYKRQGNTGAAIGCFKRALQIRESPIGYSALAELLIRESRHVEAEESLQSALRLDPSLGMAQELLGIVMEETGRFAEAWQELKAGYDLQPEKTSILYRMSRCKRMSEADRPFIELLEQLSKSPKMSDEKVRYLEYALGKVYDDLGQFGEAIGHFDKANQVSKRLQFAGRSYPLAEFRTRFNALKLRFTPDFFKENRDKVGSISDRPIFIVGMIRSGTTLVEQILSSHPDIVAAGELPYWLDPPAKSAVEALASNKIDLVALQSLATGYLDTLDILAGTKRRVTDKMPNNYMSLGLVHMLFPKARIIHCRRNPIDNCLSIYTTLYSEAPKFAYDRENIVAAYGLYSDLMDHWSRVIPSDRLLTVDYEDVVTGSESAARKMVEFCGLPWDDSCLHHEKNDRIVKTPSLWQVRQPIYETSIDRWKNYKPWLGAFARLEPSPADRR